MDFKAVIFDLDGTLLNTLPDLSESLNDALAAYGFPIHSPESCKSFVGNGLRVLVDRALQSERLTSEEYEKLYNDFLVIYRARQLGKTVPYAGIAELLTALKPRLPLGILSNKADPNTQEVVAHYFPDVFKAVRGDKEDGHTKPHPGGALEVAALLGCRPSEIVLVGDSEVDMATARAAGMTPCGVAWGFRSPEALLKAWAWRVIYHPSDLLAVI